MEAIADSGIEWLFRIGTGGGFLALVYVTLKFFGSSQTEAVSAYADLYKLVKEERDQFAADLGALRVQIAALRLELEEERNARIGLERQLAASGQAAASVFQRKQD